MTTILHITTDAHWTTALNSGAYRAPSLSTEGFIHCSTPAQVLATANRYYHGQRDLLLLWIESERVAADVRWEPATNNESYPHIYGPLNLDAVTEVTAFVPASDGTFQVLVFSSGQPL